MNPSKAERQKRKEFEKIVKSYLPVSQIARMSIPEGRKGRFKVEHKEIPKGKRLQFYNSQHGKIATLKIPIDFPAVILNEDGDCWMSSTPFEIEALSPPVERIEDGDKVLMGGLGIGLLPTMCMLFQKYPEFNVVEIEEDIIDLVAEHLKEFCEFQVNVTHGDIWKYLEETDEKYDFIHIDVWGSIIASIKELQKASDLAEKCLSPDGEVYCWLQALWSRVKGKLPKEPVDSSGLATEPCLICGKVLRNDYAGLCMDCADSMGVSEIWRWKK